MAEGNALSRVERSVEFLEKIVRHATTLESSHVYFTPSCREVGFMVSGKEKNIENFEVPQDLYEHLVYYMKGRANLKQGVKLNQKGAFTIRDRKDGSNIQLSLKITKTRNGEAVDLELEKTYA